MRGRAARSWVSGRPPPPLPPRDMALFARGPPPPPWNVLDPGPARLLACSKCQPEEGVRKVRARTPEVTVWKARACRPGEEKGGKESA